VKTITLDAPAILWLKPLVCSLHSATPLYAGSPATAPLMQVTIVPDAIERKPSAATRGFG